ncbi:MAG TPA: TCR/Tet family MFS transporter [Verrucomicrobiales bacterium]|nr:TCR/Tet family MFS transporter [Verrucomicrobiales bacterium]
MTTRKPALSFIFITLFLDVLGIGLVVPILPKLVEQLAGGGMDSASFIFGWLVGLYALMQFLFAPIIGSLSDRFGRRPVILLSLFGSGLDYFLLAWAPTLPWFFLGRILSGISGANFSAAAAYIADVSPPEKRSANFGILGAAFGLGFIFGPALGGWLGHYGLRVPFYAAGILTLVNWLYGFLILPESLKAENKREFSFNRSNPIGALLQLGRQRLVLGLSTSYFISSIAHQVYPSIWVLYTGYRYDWGTKQTGLSLALVGVMAAIVQGGLTRIIIPKIGERRAAVSGLLIMAVALTGYGLAPRGWMVYIIIVFGSLSGIAVPAIQGMISRTVGDNEQGGIQGALTGMQSVAGFIGPPLATGLFGYFISDRAPAIVPGAAFFFSSGLALMAAMMAARSFRRNPLEARSEICEV